MARYRRSTRYGSRRPRRRFDWADFSTVGGTGIEFTDSNTAGIADALANYQSANNLAADVDGLTITRIRGTIWWVPAATLAQEYTGLVFGIKTEDKVNIADLTDAQATARVREPEADWMYYKRMQTASASAISDNGAFQAQGWPNHLDVDIKSQRKLQSLDESLFFYAGLTDSVGEGNAVRIFYHLRILLKKP